MNRTFDSNGPDVKIRGTAAHIYEKYQALARDANASGDRIAAESYLQHAEHYYRILSAYQNQPGNQGGFNPRPNGGGAPDMANAQNRPGEDDQPDESERGESGEEAEDTEDMRV